MPALHVTRASIDVPVIHLPDMLAHDRQQAAALGVEYTFVPCQSRVEILSGLEEADVILNLGLYMTRRVFERLERCKLVICSSVGYDHIDVAAATERGIAVANLPLFCVDEVADHTMALLLDCVRKTTYLSNLMKRGHWGQDRLGHMLGLCGSTLGLIGAGNIGRRVAERAHPFGIEVIAYDPYIAQETASAFGATLVSMEELLARSDFVSVHAPLSAETRHMIGEEHFRAMKSTAYFINTARGPVVDEQALIRALQEGWIAGAGLDVFEIEPLPADSPLLQIENVVLTPHTAGYSTVMIRNQRAMTWEGVRRFQAGSWPDGVVNPSVLSRYERAVQSGS